MRSLLVLGIVVVGAALAYVRLAPSDAAQWHVDIDVAEEKTGTGEARRFLPGGAAQIFDLHNIILQTPRTRVVAGDPAQGHVTYVTRSAVFGFPDYTTVQTKGADLALWGRLRFGSSDMGVNAARMDGWLNALGTQ